MGQVLLALKGRVVEEGVYRFVVSHFNHIDTSELTHFPTQLGRRCLIGLTRLMRRSVLVITPSFSAQVPAGR